MVSDRAIICISHPQAMPRCVLLIGTQLLERKWVGKRERSYQVHITAIKPNPATVCARLIRTTARPRKKDFTRTEHEFEWMSGEKWFIWALIPRLRLETSRSSELCNHEQWFHNCWLSPRHRFMYSQSFPRERQRWREIEGAETIQPQFISSFSVQNKAWNF